MCEDCGLKEEECQKLPRSECCNAHMQKENDQCLKCGGDGQPKN
jgi:hypothetical protein